MIDDLVSFVPRARRGGEWRMRRSRAAGSARRRDGSCGCSGVLARLYAAEGERRLLWLPVFFGAGIGVYFSLSFEPPLWAGFGATLRRRHRELCAAPAPAAVRSGAGAGAVLRRVCADRRDRLAASGADIAAPARPGRDHRAGHRHRLARSRLAGRCRARSVARARTGRAAGAPAHPHRGDERRVGAGRPRRDARRALSGAGADPAGEPRHAARGLFRADRRSRLHLRAGASGGRRRRCRKPAAGARSCGGCAPTCRGGSLRFCPARPAVSPRR